MHSSTESYLALQNLYKSRARSDLLAFQTCLEKVLKDIGLEPNSIDQAEVEGFVKNTSGVAVVKGVPLGARRAVTGELKNRAGEGDLSGI